jgi:hypothetical protein
MLIASGPLCVCEWVTLLRDGQSCFSRLSYLVLFALNLGPALLLSSGDFGSPLIAHATLSSPWLKSGFDAIQAWVQNV